MARSVRVTLLLALHISARSAADRYGDDGRNAHSNEIEYGVETEEGDPTFVKWIGNVTAPVGKDVTLQCSVQNVGNYKVGWMKSDTGTILTVHDQVVTTNPRISVSHDMQHTWSIHIRQLKASDHGCYMCQLNAKPMRSQMGCVDVQVPPDINSDESSSDLSLAEGETARLTCTAHGYPRPNITWRREDYEPIFVHGDYRNRQKEYQANGETLLLTKITRRQMGAYLCIARNDVPPAISKRIFVYVNFRPEITAVPELLGTIIGEQATLRCDIQAYPNTVNYWVNNRNEMLLGTPKHLISDERHGYRTTMWLRILRVSEDDIGVYRCVSSNSMGSAEGEIRLHKIYRRPTAAGRGRSVHGPRHTAATEVPPPLPAASAAGRPAPLPAASLLVTGALPLAAAVSWRR
ncbi:neurotrimin-like [Amphibalanus amphitrite]|uniref:neurotrimin-like n=1 Tax=Amphibalanus amphitrite TaxID=1232801 RepID=UPI001C91CF4A|nr:neurotrimin-like [Amphibalanus amphitrite]